MKRRSVCRQAVLSAVCLWTALLLCLQFSPQRMQTKTLGAQDSARAYTVPAAQDLTQEQQNRTEDITATEQAAVFEISAPTVASDRTSEPLTETQTETGQTPLQTVQTQNTANTSPTTAAAAQEQTQAQSDAQPQRLPVLQNTQPTDVGASTMRPLRFGAQVTTALPGNGLGVVYILTVTERGSIQYTLGYVNDSPFSEVGWKLTLYEEYDRLGNSGTTAYRMLNILTSSTATDTVMSANIGVQPGTYRLILEQNGAFSADDVTVLANFTAETDRECEPNDTAARYTELYTGYAMKGSSNKYASSTDTDEDWYLFRMPYDGYAHYTFTHAAMDMISVGWQIYLYDAELNQLSFNNAAIAEGSVTGEKVGLSEGIYFICVKGRVHSTQDYTVKVDTVQAQLFEQESNDTAATATPAQTGVAYNGMMNNRSHGIDYDCYAVNLTKAGSLQITFRHAALNEDQDGWNISLLTANGDVLYTTVSNWMDTVNISPEMGVAAGTYYVRIDSDNRYFTSEAYTVQIDHTSDLRFEAEPNNSADKASEAVIGRTVKGSLTQLGLETDCDYFTVYVPSDAVIALTFSHEVIQLDRLGWRITLTDADGNVYTPMDEKGLPLTDKNGAICNELPVNWNQADSTAYYSLRAGDYFIRIDAGDYFSSETYTLLLQNTK